MFHSVLLTIFFEGLIGTQIIYSVFTLSPGTWPPKASLHPLFYLRRGGVWYLPKYFKIFYFVNL